MKIRILIVLAFLLPLQALAQQDDDENARWYAGFQAGVPLFWGDIFSTGKHTHLGYAGGIFAGYRLNRWLSAELSADYGQGKLGAGKWQTEDYINNAGIITYTSGSWKLGEVYSRTTFLRAGLRLPVSILPLLNPSGHSRFKLSLAPHLYFNHFTPGIYAVSGNKKLTDGVKPAAWAYAVGGGMTFGYKTGKKTSFYLRPLLTWLSDERYEGISSQPSWRVNLMGMVSAGLQFDLGK